VIDLLATHELLSLLLEILFSTLWLDREFEAIRKEGFLLNRVKATVYY
jgi:hypothetical protein